MSNFDGISSNKKLLSSNTITGVNVNNWLTVIAGNKLRDKYCKPWVNVMKTIPYSINKTISFLFNDLTSWILVGFIDTNKSKIIEANKYLKPEKRIGVIVFNPILIMTKDVDHKRVTKKARKILIM